MTGRHRGPPPPPRPRQRTSVAAVLLVIVFCVTVAAAVMLGVSVAYDAPETRATATRLPPIAEPTRRGGPIGPIFTVGSVPNYDPEPVPTTGPTANTQRGGATAAAKRPVRATRSSVPTVSVSAGVVESTEREPVSSQSETPTPTTTPTTTAPATTTSPQPTFPACLILPTTCPTSTSPTPTASTEPEPSEGEAP